MKLITFVCAAFLCLPSLAQEKFPDGTPVSDWFKDSKIVDINTLGKKYILTDYGVINDSTLLQTEKIQSAIDAAAQNGGGVIVIPKGTYLSGALFFKPKTHLHLEEGAVLKGSDDISNFPIIDTRMEGQSLKYFTALVNADKVDGFTLSGKGTIDGNGLRYWKSFWLRRKVNPQCTNMDELRPRLVHISHSNNVQLSGVRLINSPFWTTHLYKCNHIKLLNLYIFSPEKPVKAPSTDAIDIDVCSNVLVKNCYMSVNDDAIALKGGKGPWADQDPNNGGNFNIIIEDCTYGFCHGALTCGSESIHNRNIILRRIHITNANRLLWLKMRPDTPQLLSGGNSACKSLTGTLGNQVAFYLCGKGKSECQYLRLYIISQLIFLFHREQDDIFQHTCIQYTHYFHQSSSQTRDLRHNQCIPFLYSFQ